MPYNINWIFTMILCLKIIHGNAMIINKWLGIGSPWPVIITSLLLEKAASEKKKLI